MCGIVGIAHIKKTVNENLLKKMMGVISHRGPESEGVWFSADKTVAFGHRRLAIIDISSGGHQPMHWKDRYTITFNGEIYNYQELKQELQTQGHSFQSQSDTEVLLAAYAAWGPNCLEKINGMFAFGIWDKLQKELFIARDHVGEKPLKYYTDQETIIFSSEVKAIIQDPTVPRDIDWQAIDVALSFRYVPAPQTGFKAVKKLPAGHYLIWKDGQVTIKQHWFPEKITTNTSLSFNDWKKTSWELFVDSVGKRLMSDVPLGAFLSGGIDSTSVVAAVKEITSSPLETFVVSLGGKSEDQVYAGIAATYFGTKHHTIALPTIDYRQVITQVTKQYDEPFFDQSALPNMLIAAAMKKHVTVVLSGDGGDELFGGYSAYQLAKTFKKYSAIPARFRKLAARALFPFRAAAYRAEVLSADFYSSYTDYYSLWKKHLPVSHKYLTKDDLYRPELKKQLDLQRSSTLMKEWFASESDDLVNNAMLADIRGRLADGYLTKVDLATMASAIEARPPFLDRRLVEHALRMPSKFKINNRQAKYIWKEIVKDKLPVEIINRPKAGFSIPLHELVKGDMRPLIEETILSSQSIVNEYFSTQTIRRLWLDHLAGKADYSNHLWSLLTLELWLKHYLEK